jgi:hypothetical protein
MMKNQLVISMCLLFVCAVNAYSDSDDATIPFKSTTFKIGPEIFYDKYEEFDHGSIMTEKGMFYGIAVSNYNRPWVNLPAEEVEKRGKWMVGLEGEAAYGRVNYDGQTQDGDPTSIYGLKDVQADARLLGGPEFTFADRLETIYFGIGYRYLRDDSSFDSEGYLRQSDYVYVPVGVKVESYKSDTWSVGGSLELDVFLFGKQVSTIDNFNYPCDQHTGYGLRAALNIDNISETSRFAIQPFVRFWHIDESDADNKTGTYIEPENKTTQLGIQLIWTF